VTLIYGWELLNFRTEIFDGLWFVLPVMQLALQR